LTTSASKRCFGVIGGLGPLASADMFLKLVRAALAGGESREGRTIIIPDRLHIRKNTRPPSPKGFGGLRSLGEGACPPPEGQAREGRIFIKRAIAGGNLDAGLVKKCQELLDERHAAIRLIALWERGDPPDVTPTAIGLSALDAKLFARTVEVAGNLNGK